MPHHKLKKWSDLKARKTAVLSVLSKAQLDPEFRRRCLSSPEYLRQVFVEEHCINVPGDVLVCFVPEGDRDNHIKNQSGSLVFEVPPPTVTMSGDLFDYVRCTYVLWLRSSRRPTATKRRPRKR